MDTVKKISPAKVIEAYEKIGSSKKKLDSLSFKTEETPLEGTIIEFDSKPAEYEGNKYFTFKVSCPDGQIRKLSVNRLFDNEVVEGQYLVIKNEQNKGKVMLKSIPVSGNLVRMLGNSQAERISNIIGKSYKAQRITSSVLIEYTPEKLFLKPEHENKPSESELETLWQNTAISDRLFKFTEIK